VYVGGIVLAPWAVSRVVGKSEQQGMKRAWNSRRLMTKRRWTSRAQELSCSARQCTYSSSPSSAFDSAAAPLRPCFCGLRVVVDCKQSDAVA
jgi:hypothetical protein